MRRDLDPDVLRTFVAISEEGSFRGAAARVGRSQSAISIQIQKLEQIVDGQLFFREKPAGRLTPKGDALLLQAHRILRLQEEVLFELRDKPENTSLRFGIPDDYAFGLLQTILSRFCAEHPTVELTVVCNTSSQLVKMIKQGDLDVAVVSRQASEPAGTFLKSEPIVWVSAKDHAPEMRDIMPLAVFQDDCLIRQNAVKALEKAGKEYRICFKSPNLAALCALVSTGMAVAAIPASSVPKNLRVLDAVDFLPPMPSIEIVMMEQANSTSETVARFVECVNSIGHAA